MSLVARLFKAQYFKHVDAMEAEVGPNASYVRRSICWSRDLLEKGLRWNIENGASIRLFKDAWVHGLADGKLSSRIASGSAVSRFIMPYGQWDEELIHQAFLPYEVDAIHTAPIIPSLSSDARFWFPEKKGKYSVKSEYKYYWKRKLISGGSSSSSNQACGESWWNKVWSLCIPPKIRIFAWKMARNFVATEGNLARHHVPCSPRCFICGYGLADTPHVFFFYPAVRHIWKRYNLWHHIKGLRDIDVQEMLSTLSALKLLSLEEIIMVCWGFWRERCDFKHGKGGIGVQPFSTEWALHYHHDFQTWPQLLMHHPSLLLGGEVHIFTDSQDAIHAIRSNENYLGPEGATLRDIHVDLEMIKVKDISYVPRPQNLVAHGLAKLASGSR